MTTPKQCADCSEILTPDELDPAAPGSLICRACFYRLHREWGTRPPLLTVGNSLADAQIKLPPWRAVEAMEDQVADIKRALRGGCSDEERAALERELLNHRRGLAFFIAQVFEPHGDHLERQRRRVRDSLRRNEVKA